jgi:nucleoside 2-deoxyribosyltransferase
MCNLYLAGPIDLVNASAKPVISWKASLEALLKERANMDLVDNQWTCYDPARPWLLCGQFIHTVRRTAFIELVNTAAINHCDVVVAHVPSTVVSVGTPIEINDAIVQHKPVVIISDIPYGKNAYLTNRVPSDRYIRYDPDGAVDLLANQITEVLYMISAEMADDFGGYYKKSLISSSVMHDRLLGLISLSPKKKARAGRPIDIERLSKVLEEVADEVAGEDSMPSMAGER